MAVAKVKLPDGTWAYIGMGPKGEKGDPGEPGAPGIPGDMREPEMFDLTLLLENGLT